jgi:hypothetical protein
MSSIPTQRKSLFAAMNSLADELHNEKVAAANAVKRAEGPTPADPGGMAGKSTHPSATADNGCQTPTEGARSSENEADVKEQQGPPSVNNTSEAKPGDDKDRSINQGTQASLVGDDPATEDNYKTDKDDPGTSHPAKTDDGKKYGSASFKEAHAKIGQLSNELLADIFHDLGTTPKAAGAPAKPSAPAAAMQAGYELAAGFGLTKEAAEAGVRDAIAITLQDALLEADLIGSYLKSAGMDEASEGEDHAKPSGEEEGSGSGSGEGEGASSKPGDSASDGGGSAGAGAGGPPPGGDMAGPPMGGDPLAGGGAGGGSPEEVIQELVSAMVEMGVTPEMFAQLSASAGGGAGGPPGMGAGGPPPMGAGGPPPGAGGPPGMGAPPPGGDPMALGAAGAPPGGGGGDMSGLLQDGAKLAAVTRNFMRSGRFEFKEAKTVRSRQLRNLMKGHIRELLA